MTGAFRSQTFRTRMKAAATAAAALFALAALNAAPASAQNATLDPGVRAFKDICLASAPGFTAGAEAAKKYGIASWTPLGKAKMGMTKDSSLSVQITPGKECAITTKAKAGNAAHGQFMAAVLGATKSQGITEKTASPFQASLGGKKFVFTHDRSGGEAYVMAVKK
jgi:hypothetical protein